MHRELNSFCRQEAGVRVTLWTDTQPDPPAELVHQACAIAKAEGVDGVSLHAKLQATDTSPQIAGHSTQSVYRDATAERC